MGASDHKRLITIRKVLRGEEEARADVEFWMSMSGEERVELLWDMVLDRLGSRDLEEAGRHRTDHDQPRLSRSVRRIRRS